MRGDREVAARDQLQPGGGRQAVDLGDHRLRMAHDRLHQRSASGKCLFEEGLALIGVGTARGHFLEIVAGAEHLSGRRQDDDAHGFVGLARGRVRPSAPP